MQNPKQTKLKRFAVLALLPVLILAGCTAAPDASFLHLVGSGAQLNTSPVVTSSATCPAGEQLLGGGYTALVSPGDMVSVTEDYPNPSSANTWTVTAATGTQVSGSLLAVAYCFTTPNVQLGVLPVSQNTTSSPISVLQATATGLASCPAGSVLTGGGFRVQGLPQGDVNHNSYITAEGPAPSGASQPSGWQTTLVYPVSTALTAKVFALCARNYLAPGTTVNQTFTQLNTLKGTVACAPNAFTSGGGYSLTQSPEGLPPPYTVYSSFSDTESALNFTPSARFNAYQAIGWRSDLTFHFGWKLTMSANCIPFPR
jgi:hypothetical protein